MNCQTLIIYIIRFVKDQCTFLLFLFKRIRNPLTALGFSCQHMAALSFLRASESPRAACYATWLKGMLSRYDASQILRQQRQALFHRACLASHVVIIFAHRFLAA